VSPEPSTQDGAGGFFRHARNYLLGGAFAGIVGFGAVSVLTRLLTQEEYGVLSVFLSVATIFSVLVELNLRGSVNRYYLEESDDFPSFLKTALRFLAGLTVFNLVALWLLREPLADFFKVDAWVFYCGILAAIVQVPWNLNWKLMVAQMESAAYSRLRGLRDLLLFGAGALWLISLPSAEVGDGGRQFGQIYAVLAVNGLFALFLVVKLIRVAKPGRVNRPHLKYALAFGIPLVPHALSGVILNEFDRVMINQLVDERATGLYTFAYQVGGAMAMVVVAMNQAWLPIFARLRNREMFSRIHALAVIYAQLLTAVAVLFVLFARELAYIMGGERFSEALSIIPVIVLSYVAVFLYNIYANHTFYLRRTWLISGATFIAGGVNVVLNYWLIPTEGYGIAAWTTLVSFGVLFALHYAIARFWLGEKVTPVWPLLAWFAAAAALSWLVVSVEAEVNDAALALLVVKLPALIVLGFWARHSWRAVSAFEASVKVDALP
jgi:O-antigen/teichoic acid export membrane protein